MPEKTLIVAEVGVNHNGSLDTAKKLVRAARLAGADAVKFQTFRSEDLVSVYAEKASYQKRTTGKQETQFEMLKRLELSELEYKKLVLHCNKTGVEFISTPFDLRSVDFLESIGVGRYKIASGDLTNPELLYHVGRKRKPVILSTGMANLGEVESALESLRSGGTRRITLLHCVTEYERARSYGIDRTRGSKTDDTSDQEC